MLAKLAVKKPYYVFVAVIVILILGGVSVTTMKTDLLPEFQVPYLAVMTSDIGASPEQVEEEVTKKLEGPLGTVGGVNNVYSTSSENFSMIFLEFADGTDMDSAMVKVSAAANQVVSQLPESAGTPTYLEMSMDMMASMYLGVASGTLDEAELTQVVEDEVIPMLQRQEGVANVTASGSVTDAVEIRLNQDKIDNVNSGILGEVNSKLADAKAKLDSASRQIDSSEAKLEEQQRKLDKAKQQASDGFSQASDATDQLLVNKSVLQSQIATVQTQLTGLQTQYDQLDALGLGQTEQGLQLAAQITTLSETLKTLQGNLKKLDKGLTQAEAGSNAQTSTILSLSQAQSQLDQGRATLQSSRQQLEESYKTYEQNRDDARDNANIDKLVDAATLSSLIEAQNLEMPAGYVEDAHANQWVVKVGDKYTKIKQLKNMVLTKIDGVGDITLGDVADIIRTDNIGSSYAKLNGDHGIILSITKASTANTGEVCDAVNAAADKLMASNEDIKIIPIMDQGEYIDLYINTILTSLLLGALLAVIVLAVFLKNIRPTLVVAFSIPFSVLFALVIMYFTGLTLNIMTLGALSLAIGMLVDNSIVVMENIYRLRARGLSATRAAAQGALQVTGAIVASTITSVCVFLPFVFSSGTVRELMVPFALTLSFALLASLLVALSIVPALGSKIFKNMQPSQVKWFEKLKSGYGRLLAVSLEHKAPVLVLAVVLLVVSIGLVVRMGIVILPEMTSNQLGFTLEVPEDMEKDDAYSLADTVGTRLADVDGIADVGIADANATSGTVSAFSGMSGNIYNGRFLIYALIDESKVNTEAGAADLEKRALSSCKDLDVTLISTNNIESMTSLAGGDATITVRGNDYEKVLKLSDKVMKTIESVEGYSEVSNGQEDAAKTLHLVMDKAKLARMNTSVGQVYQQISAKLQDSKTAMTMNGARKTLDVNVSTEKINDFTKENILDMTFTDGNNKEHKLSSVAKAEVEEGISQIRRENQVYTVNVTANVDDGYNVTLLVRELQPKLDKIDVPEGYQVEIAGTNADIAEMLWQMFKLALLGFILLYLVMVAQFQSLLSPFIIIFTVPLAFTGGLFALVIAGEQLSMMALFGFIILMGTVVNNGIVFVDYVNQLRLGGMAKRQALIATGTTRMRPIIMTALTTIISMCALIFSQQIGASMERGMALVVAGGLLYATFMTLFVVPAVYDIFNRKPMVAVDIGDDTDLEAGDAEEFIAQMGEDARETYDYQTRRQRRRALKARKAEERPEQDA